MWRFGRAIWLVVCILLAACAGGCDQGRSGAGVELKLWVMGQEGEAIARFLPEFEHRHPGIRVRLQQVPVSSAHEKLLTAYAGDGLPDVTPLGNTWIPEFAALDALEPLDRKIAAEPGFDRSDFYPGAWNGGVIDGKVYAIPWYAETRIPFYRADILHAAGVRSVPADWEAWRAAMRAVKRASNGSRRAIFLPLNEFEPLLNLAIHGGLLRAGGRHGNFRSSAVKRTLAFYKSLFDEGLAPRATNITISNIWDEFGKGEYAYYVSGPWNIAELRRRLPPNLANTWATMPLPGPDGPGASAAGGASFVIFRASRHKDAAWKLIAWLSSPQMQIRLYRSTGSLPSRRSPWSDPELAGDRHVRAFRDQLERARPTPPVPEWERVAAALQAVGELLANDRLTVEQAAEELDRRADVILQKRRWMLEREGKVR